MMTSLCLLGLPAISKIVFHPEGTNVSLTDEQLTHSLDVSHAEAFEAFEEINIKDGASVCLD